VIGSVTGAVTSAALRAFTVLLVLAGWAAAESWTVQTVAVRDLREAQSVAADLDRLGFDAYTEYTMSRGLQYVRVRVGCFRDRGDADMFASLLAGWAVREAVVVERVPGAPTVGCLEREVGFVAPGAWRQRGPGVASFEVEVAGVHGVIRYQSGRWQLLQAPATEAIVDLRDEDRSFVQARGTPWPFVALRGTNGQGDLLLCPGTLLAEADGAAIVEHLGVVASCRLTPPGGGAS